MQFASIKKTTDADMRFVQNFTPPEFQAKTISPNLVLVIKTQKVSGNGETYTTGKKFTLPDAVTAATNLTSVCGRNLHFHCVFGKNINIYRFQF